MKTPYDSAIERHRTSGCDDPQCRVALDQQTRRKVWLACLQSPEVTALVKALMDVLPAIRWGMTHQPGNLAQWIKVEADIEAALAPWKAEA